MIKKIFIIITLCFCSIEVIGQEVSGVFVSPYVGIRLPIQEASKKYKTGFSFGGNLEYGNSAIPFIIRLGFNYTSFPQKGIYNQTYQSSSITGVNLGFDYLITPLIASESIVAPFISADFNYNYIERQLIYYTYRFETDLKIDQKFGFTLGAGISLFLVDFVVKYNFLIYEPYLSLDYKLRLPIYVSF